MIYRDTLRFWVSKNLAPIMFLSAYFLTVVVGNVMFTTPFGRTQLERSSYTAAILQFCTLFSVGFWALLLIPFLVTPLTVKLVRSAMERHVHRVADILPEFSKTDYTLITAACFGYVFFALLKADAFALFSSGLDAISSVEARFQIHTHTGFAALAILMSVLHFLSIYSLIKWMRGDRAFWAAMTASNIVIMAVFLTVLNMKWPVLIFDMGLILAVFVYVQQKPYLKAAIGSVLLIVVYLLISSFVLRIAAPARSLPPPVPHPGPALTPAKSPRVAESTRAPTRYSQYALRLAEGALQSAPTLAIAAVNRMAIVYPYYYEVFTTEGAVCGGIIEQARVGPACRPSTFIYTRIFGDDGFGGRGTSPAAVHISGYALGGWPIAIFALICASTILGIFACLPLDMNATVGALAITGGIVGYHFSQLPGEGPLIYDHGVLWVVLMLFLYVVSRWIYVRGRALVVGVVRKGNIS